MKYWYESNHRKMILVPEYAIGPGGRVYITGAKIYSPKEKYLGFWYRHNMPVSLITSLAKYVSQWVNAKPAAQNERKYRHVKG